MSKPLPGQLGFGIPPRPNPLNDLKRDISDLEDKVQALSSTASIYPQSVNSSASNFTYPSSLTVANYATIEIDTPAGYTQCVAILTGLAGTAFSSNGLLGAGIVITGAAIANGIFTQVDGNGSTQCTASYVGLIRPDPGSYPPLDISLSAFASNTQTANSSTAALNGVLLWMP